MTADSHPFLVHLSLSTSAFLVMNLTRVLSVFSYMFCISEFSKWTHVGLGLHNFSITHILVNNSLLPESALYSAG
jgi:hypothetical protein